MLLLLNHIQLNHNQQILPISTFSVYLLNSIFNSLFGKFPFQLGLLQSSALYITKAEPILATLANIQKASTPNVLAKVLSRIQTGTFTLEGSTTNTTQMVLVTRNVKIWREKFFKFRLWKNNNCFLLPPLNFNLFSVIYKNKTKN